jgi:inhibitor of KinA
MNPYHPYSLFPLGDTALLIDFGNFIDEAVNKKVLHLFHVLKHYSHPFITDLIPGYSSLTVCYNAFYVSQKKTAGATVFETMVETIEQLIKECPDLPPVKNHSIAVPVCYAGKFATDIAYIARENKIDPEEIIYLHSSKVYRVFMIGFLPGFCYMGQVDERISIPRKPKPEPVASGSVGIAGRQTGIYPLPSPGGWQIIGRSPVKAFDKDREQPVLFQSGDEVKFYSITEDEFTHYQAGRT